MASGRVIVFGGRGGLGRELCAAYSAAGFAVTSVDRDRCDLSDPAAVERVLREPELTGGRIEVCLFAAGLSEAGRLEDLDGGALRRCFEVNLLAPLAVLSRLAAGPAACRSFVFVLSGAADVLVPGLAPYALSKRALRDALRIRTLERSFQGVRVLQVYPGPMETDFDRKTRVHGAFTLPSSPARRSPEEVARRIFDAERAGRGELLLSPLARAAGILEALCPRLAGWLAARFFSGAGAPRPPARGS